MNSLKPLLFGLVLGLTLAAGLTVYATWSPPTAAPPGCTAGNPGCDAPINVGSEEQRKAGSLVVEGEFSTLSNIAAVGSIAAGMDMTIDGSMLVGELASAPNPAQNYGRIYVNSSDRKLYYKDSTGIAYDLTATGGGAGGGETLIELANFDASTADNYAWVVPAEAVLLHIDVRGPEGATGEEKCYEGEGNDDSRPCTAAYGGGPGGKGARVQARFSGLEGRTLYINVGSVYSNRGVDIRNGGSALANRIIVAGGGGAGSSAGMETGGFRGGDGGLNGQDGELPEWGGTSGGGATPSVAGVGGTGTGSGTDGTLGYGGSGFDGIDVDGGLGGGGMYGGGGGGGRALPAPSHEYYATGGGGGSSYSSGDNTTYETGANAGNGRIIIYQVVAGSGGGGGGMTGSGAVNTIAMFTGETVLGASKLTQHSGYMTVDGDLVIRADRGLYLGNNEDGGGLYFSGVGRMYAQQSDKKLYYSTFGGDIFDLTGGGGGGGGGLPSGAV